MNDPFDILRDRLVVASGAPRRRTGWSRSWSRRSCSAAAPPPPR